MQGKSSITAGYHSSNATIVQAEEQMYEATIGALSNLATESALDRGMVSALTQTHARPVKKLEDNSNKLRELKAVSKKKRFEELGQRNFNPSPNNYCWTHGCKAGNTHTSLTYKLPKPGHKKEAT
jgi:hypothetical protein